MISDQLTIGGWVSTDTGCPVRCVVSQDKTDATLILGSPRHEFEISLDTTTLEEVVRQGTQALADLNTPAGAQG